jgi:hypothetical protein
VTCAPGSSTPFKNTEPFVFVSIIEDQLKRGKPMAEEAEEEEEQQEEEEVRDVISSG